MYVDLNNSDKLFNIYQFHFCRQVFGEERLSSTNDATVDDGRKFLQLFNPFLKKE